METLDPIIECKDLCYSIGKQDILKKLNLTIQSGTSTGLLGPNGSGKTTLFKLLAGILLPTRGDIQVSRATKKGIIFQHTDQNLLPWKTAIQNILLPYFRETESVQHSVEAHAMSLLTKFDLMETCHKYPRELSGGQKQIISLLRWLIRPPDILFIDEGWSMLDVVQKDRVHKLINVIRTKERSIFMVSHSPSELARLCDQVYLLSDAPGEIVDFIRFDKCTSDVSKEVLLWEKATQVFSDIPEAS
jgi:ABC-type nitrate/sulfonate/bicarbonate transport system ATPase subunit